MHIKNLLNASEKLVSDNAPTILAGIAVVGTAATGYLAARGGYRAARKLSEGPPTENLEFSYKVKRVGLEFIPALGAGAATISCIVFAQKINASRAAALVAAYSLSENKLSEYRGKVAEKLGIKSEAEIQDEANEERRKKTAQPMIVLGGGEHLIFDAPSGRYFKGTMESVRAAVNDTNFEVNHNNYASLQYFYELVGLDATAFSSEQGWSITSPMEIRWGNTTTGDDAPALMIDYDTEPLRRYNHLG